MAEDGSYSFNGNLLSLNSGYITETNEIDIRKGIESTYHKLYAEQKGESKKIYHSFLVIVFRKQDIF